MTTHTVTLETNSASIGSLDSAEALSALIAAGERNEMPSLATLESAVWGLLDAAGALHGSPASGLISDVFAAYRASRAPAPAPAPAPTGTPIAVLGKLSVRTASVLDRAGITTVEGLTHYQAQAFLHFRNSGRKVVAELTVALAVLGLSFAK